MKTRGEGKSPAPSSEKRGMPKEEQARNVAKLFREHNQSLVRFLALRLQSVQEAREVAQEAYVRLLQLDRPTVKSFMRAYLFRIASNLAVDRVRRQNTEARITRIELFDELDDVQEPERRTLASEELELVRRCLDELPENCRRAFLLHRIDGMSVAEIAEELEVSGRMVRHHLERALVYCRLRRSGDSPAQAREKMKR